MNSRRYHVGSSVVTVGFGDLLRSAAEVLVSSDDYHLSMGGGVSAALRLAAGPSLQTEARKFVPARLGDVVVTSAGELKARYVFHAVTIGRKAEAALRDSARSAGRGGASSLPRP